MNVFKIAWRSIQHRGFGSWLTILSMALGVMLVVCVLSIHGLVSRSFKSNNSFGFNVLVGARGGGLQLTMNSVYYLSQPVENVPYEYYLAFRNQEDRSQELKNSIAWAAMQAEKKAHQVASASGAVRGLGSALLDRVSQHAFERQQLTAMEFERPGLYSRYVELAVPLCLGDYYVDEETGAAFRCVGTNSDFLEKLVLDIETERNFEFQQGRNFVYFHSENGFNECVVGATVARKCGLKIGDTIKPTHGDPNSTNAHIHDNPFKIVGILKPTETPNDRILFLNMEGFFLMDGHTNPLATNRILKTSEDEAQPVEMGADLFADEEDEGTENNEEGREEELEEPLERDESQLESVDNNSNPSLSSNPLGTASVSAETKSSTTSLNQLSIKPLAIEQRQVTSFLVRTSKNDPYGVIPHYLIPQINKEDDLESTLKWSPYRPARSQKSAQAVSPIDQVTSLFQLFVDPVRWLLLALTCMICVVSALSILVGIYNSMSQRQHEIAIIRALGASRSKVMTIMLCEAMLLALIGGFLGWFLGHLLNVAIGPWVEAYTGVSIGFFDLAPGLDLRLMPGAESLPEFLTNTTVSSELLIIPGLIVLAIMVGIYPAISAYKTDVSRALAK
jgi:putative ABC transport system permease protein